MSKEPRADVLTPAEPRSRQRDFDEFYVAELPRLVALVRGLTGRRLPRMWPRRRCWLPTVGGVMSVTWSGLTCGCGVPARTWRPHSSAVASSRSGRRFGWPAYADRHRR